MSGGGSTSVVRSGPQVRSAIVVLAVFLAFTAGAVASWESFGSTVGPSFFYPSAGVTVAALMLTRRSLWPAIAIAVVAAELLVDTLYGNPVGLSVAFALSNVVEPVVGASIVLAWCGGRPDLSKRHDFIAFLLGACVAGPLVGGLIGGSASAINSGAHWLGTAVTWSSGDALGVLVVASPILLWSAQSHVLRKRPWETAAMLLITAALSVATFWVEAPPSLLLLPVLALAAFRLNMLGAALTGAVAAFLGNIMTTRGQGLFASYDISQSARVALTQAFIATIVVVAMLIGQEAAARLSAQREREVEHRERVRLETLAWLAQELFIALTPRDIGEALESHVLNEAGASGLALGLVSSDGRTLEWVTASGYPPSMVDEFSRGMDLSERCMAGDVIRLGNPIAMRTASEYTDAYPDRAHWLTVAGIESLVGWPLTSGGDPFGTLQLVWSDPQPLDTTQLAYISAVASLVSQALVRARVYADEHSRAAVLHSVAQPVAAVEVVGLEYRALYEPDDATHGLGGDWYSVMPLAGDRTYLSVGDVIGHGLTAVEDMAQLRSTGNAYAYQGLRPAHLLSDLNRFAGAFIRGEFATTLVAIFDPATQSLSYSSAGHPPALLRRADTGEVIRLSAEGPVLGPFADSLYGEQTVTLHPGDVVVMYTDGLVEHHGHNVQAGIAHLEQVITHWPPDALLDCEALAEAVAPAPHADDICLLMVRVAGA